MAKQKRKEIKQAIREDTNTDRFLPEVQRLSKQIHARSVFYTHGRSMLLQASIYEDIIKQLGRLKKKLEADGQVESAAYKKVMWLVKVFYLSRKACLAAAERDVKEGAGDLTQPFDIGDFTQYLPT